MAANLKEGSDKYTSILCNGSEKKLNGRDDNGDVCTLDGHIEYLGIPARRDKTSNWPSGLLLLVNQGLCSVAFAGVEVNLVHFLTRVMKQSNTRATNTFSGWIGMNDLFSLVGAFLSDAFLGQYLTCIIFQAILITGLVMLSLTTLFLLLQLHGRGDVGSPCDPKPSPLGEFLFYISIYIVALGHGAYEPSLATFGSNQFDEEHPGEKAAEHSFYSYFYVATNIGTFFSETVLAYMHDSGYSSAAFWVSSFCGIVAYVLLLSGSKRRRHFKPCGIPLARFCQVKWILRLIPIWLCTTFFSIVIVQMPSLFIEQGMAMNTKIHGFRIPPSSMTAVNVISVSTFILFFDKLIAPLYTKLTKRPPMAPSDINKMGIGLITAFVSMIIAGIVEQQRLKHARVDGTELSSLSLLWLVPQYTLIGVSETLLFVGQLNFFESQTPDAMKSIGFGLCMFSSFFGSCVCSFIVTIVMEVTTRGGSPGWIPANLNEGHLDRFFFLMAGLTVVEFFCFAWCAEQYKCSSLERREADVEAEVEMA